MTTVRISVFKIIEIILFMRPQTLRFPEGTILVAICICTSRRIIHLFSLWGGGGGGGGGGEMY